MKLEGTRDLSLIVNLLNTGQIRYTVYLFAETSEGSVALEALAKALQLNYGLGHGSEALGTYKPFCYIVLKEE